MTQIRTLEQAWCEARVMIDLHYPGYEVQFDQLKPVSYDGNELILASDIPYIVNLFAHPRWWLGVGDHVGFVFGAVKRVKFTVISSDNVVSRE
jgi:hypothetical protein